MMAIKQILALTLIVLPTFCMSQEDCANGIDDDGDTFIDLNDDECDCGIATSDSNLVSNHSFEEMSCCPISFSMFDCADGWIQPSTGTTDYWNICGWSSYAPFTDAEMPLPGDPGGTGWSGFISMPDWNEYLGQCLGDSLWPDETYIIELWVAKADGEDMLELSIYGAENCSDMPWAGAGCPLGSGEWQLLGNQMVDFDTEGEWIKVDFTFTITDTVRAIAIGGPCDPAEVPTGDSYNYYYVDEIKINGASTYPGVFVSSSGDWCDEDLELTASYGGLPDGGSWQWYLNGVAILGEISDIIGVLSYGVGNYTAVYSISDSCFSGDYEVIGADGLTADFMVDGYCVGEPISFTDNSSSTSGVIESWFWDFGDTFNSTDQNTTHIYSLPGTYTVSLAIEDSTGCETYTTQDITIIAPDTSVTVTDTSLISNQSGAIYQWIDCDGAFTWMGGETYQELIPNSNGNYAVIVNLDGCIDTSACYELIVEEEEIDDTGFGETGNLDVSVYPNPANGKVTVSLSSTVRVKVEVTDILGRSIIDIPAEYTNHVEEIVLPGKGTYFIRVDADGWETVKRVVSR